MYSGVLIAIGKRNNVTYVFSRCKFYIENSTVDMMCWKVELVSLTQLACCA